MLNRIDSTSFGGKISITNFKDVNHFQKTTIPTGIVEDRLIKLTAKSICKRKASTQPIEDKVAGAFAKLIEMITGKKLKKTEQTKTMTVFDNQIIFADKKPKIDGESVIIDLDERI